MSPVPELVSGLTLLEPFLESSGFVLDSYENGEGSGGHFTIATFKNGHKKIVIGYRFSVGQLDYRYDDSVVGHDFYLKQLGHAETMKFPDFQSDDKLESFRHILADFQLLKSDFFNGDCKELIRIVKIQKAAIEKEGNKRQVEYDDHFDHAIILRARREFKEKKFKESAMTYKTVRNAELLTDLDKKILKIAKEKRRSF